MLLAANSSSVSLSSKAKFTALTVALSSVLRRDLDMFFCPRFSKPSNKPARTHRCLHRGDLSSAPLTTATAHSPLLRALRLGYILFSCGGPSCDSRWTAADLKMPRMRRVVLRPSGRCHIEGAESNWDVRSVIFNGFDNSVSNVIAEPSSLYVSALRCGGSVYDSLPGDILLV